MLVLRWVRPCDGAELLDAVADAAAGENPSIPEDVIGKIVKLPFVLVVGDGKLGEEVAPLSTTIDVTDRERVPSREDSEGKELELATGIGR